MTRTLVANLVGISPYSQSRAHDEPKIDDKESHDAYDRRTWRSKAHVDADTGQVVIPAMGLKLAIAEAARRLAIKIPGKRGATYTKNVLSGVLVVADMPLGITRDDLREEVVFANADGKRGSGTRVFRRFPMVPTGWKATAEIHLIDSEIPEEVVERCLREAGNLIGIGRFRPQNGGYLGRFEVTAMKWNKTAPQRLAA
ncbi:hypothetical protein [Aquamicrobium sp.]|uniref:hypothetical protein n=1 Tax=Aquamicrobium sp. TaxID=1872579 RepID=UPI00258B2625|nr:hypothetical protein [Aquamicrobium sp.]MCK9549200.1 hypothetical protein [Aquamicrobium sp.]